MAELGDDLVDLWMVTHLIQEGTSLCRLTKRGREEKEISHPSEDVTFLGGPLDWRPTRYCSCYYFPFRKPPKQPGQVVPRPLALEQASASLTRANVLLFLYQSSLRPARFSVINGLPPPA